MKFRSFFILLSIGKRIRSDSTHTGESDRPQLEGVYIPDSANRIGRILLNGKMSPLGKIQVRFRSRRKIRDLGFNLVDDEDSQ